MRRLSPHEWQRASSATLRKATSVVPSELPRKRSKTRRLLMPQQLQLSLRRHQRERSGSMRGMRGVLPARTVRRLQARTAPVSKEKVSVPKNSPAKLEVRLAVPDDVDA